MEGAGATIVSDAAEHATRGMDSVDEEPETSNVRETEEEPETPDVSETDEEPETPDVSETDEEPKLPSAVQDLIRCLEGKGKPVTRFPDFSSSEFRKFFPRRELISTMTGWRSQVRLRVLEAIGDCNTFEDLVISGGGIWRLTASEREIVFRRFMSRTIQRIYVGGNKWSSEWSSEWSSDEEVESLCLQLGGILNCSSVRELTIFNCRLSARCWLNLASGLSGNCESKLESLDLEEAWEDSSAVKHVADMINSAPLLQKLGLRGSSKMDDEAVGMLSQALIQRSSLKVLFLRKVEWGAALLLKALAGDDRNRSIERLELQQMAGLGDCLREVLTSNPSLKEVVLEDLWMRPEDWHQLGKGIRDNATAECITVPFTLRNHDEDRWKSIEALACAASSDVKDPTVDLSLKLKNDHHLVLSVNLLGRVLRGEIKSLQSFNISVGRMESIERIYWENGSRGERLSILNVTKAVLMSVLPCLRGNTSLYFLDLSSAGSFRYDDERLDDEAFRCLMGLLQVNLTIQEIDVFDTPWEKDGKAAQIQEALQQNQKRAVYMSVFREAKLTFGDAKAGRLFLCGSPLAGKTKVRQTLMRIVKGKSWFGNKVEQLWRTQGIEVEWLQNDDKTQISIWDLAGQGIFRTLQTVLFPQSSNFCIFLFVYSPFYEETDVSSQKKKPDSCFQTELEAWLSFITSTTRVTGHNRPQVLVVITHKDKVKYHSLKWAHSIVETLTKRFTNFVDLHQECFYLDARKKKEVIPLKNHIFEIFKNLLSEKSPRVPKLCSRLSFLLVTNTKNNRKSPLWQIKTFQNFCASELTDFIPSSSAHADDHSKIMSAIISYLNDVGSIVYIPNFDYIIVDPNWLTNTLLGELVTLGQNFQTHKSMSFEKTMSHYSYASNDGFVSESDFDQLIEEFRRKQPHGVNRQVLEDILINLDLCFKVEDPSQYFIPSFIPEPASTEEQNSEKLAWKTGDKNSKYVGIRIQCQDETTMSFTAAFFPCFQMFMRRKLISEKHFGKETVIFSRHYLRLLFDGYEIYIEQGTSYKYVDVLMLGSQHKSRSEALQYMRTYIIDELISFCASSKGCPGVALVMGVIQTRCVEMLIPSDLRGAILIEDLKSDYIRRINDKLEDIAADRLRLVKEEQLFNYQHSWPSIRGHTPEIFEKARDLLSESDVEEVVNEIQQKHIQQLESFRQALNSVSNDLNQPCTQSGNRVGNSSYSDRLDRSNSDKQDERLRSMESMLQQILTGQLEVQSTLSFFMSEMDRFIQYSHELQQAKTPKRPYVTTDVGVIYRMKAALNAGTIVRLHFMCEYEYGSGIHMVKDQEGLMIHVDRENCEWIRNTIEISCKIMYYALKAGLDKTLNLGQAIPDWEDFKSDIVKLDFSNRDRRALLKGGESRELNEAWFRIQQTLAPINYSAIFKLYQVKYARQELGGHAWVCEECMVKGRSSSILTD
ncbi:hypothetical protein MPTK1_7g10710 [Marchantia polymorpha subsp. ruderalis]|uniref:C-terminal of Roc (COR) domain-containing protein n=1 Tax=Marchantia polymorpha subsp. ruderalis TaxID=1480154 RepID=A0AAF6BY67_MARPO|nr:hypothetical protein Mp_7g10710 [Marchantia polymorpha subsp. ruderalis]